MQVQRVAFVQPIEIALAAYALAQFGLRQPFPLHTVMFGQQGLALAQHRRIAEPVGPDHALIHRIARDAVAEDALTDALDGGGGQPEQGTCALGAELIQQRPLAQRVAGEDEPTVAPGSTEAHLLALEQHHIGDAALGQAKRGIETGVTAADDRYPRITPTLQRCKRRVAVRRGAVIGGGRGGWHHGRADRRSAKSAG